MLKCHPSVYYLLLIWSGSQGQQPKQECPDLPLTSHHLQPKTPHQGAAIVRFQLDPLKQLYKLTTPCDLALLATNYSL